MKPARARKLLNAYLEGDLDAVTRDDLEHTLVREPELRRELRELEATVALLRGLPEPPPPPALAAQVMERVRAGEAEPARFLDGLRRLFDPALWLPATAAAAAVAVFVTTPDGAPREASAPVQVAEAQDAMDRARSQREFITRIRAMQAEGLRGRAPHAPVTNILRGAGHPHSASLASQLDDEFDRIVFANFAR